MNIVSFPRWLEVITQDDALSSEQKKAYPITIRWFLGYLKRNRQKASVSAARDFMAQAIGQKSPRPAVEQKWKDALNSFFKNGKKIKANRSVLSQIQ